MNKIPPPTSEELLDARLLRWYARLRDQVPNFCWKEEIDYLLSNGIFGDGSCLEEFFHNFDNFGNEGECKYYCDILININGSLSTFVLCYYARYIESGKVYLIDRIPPSYMEEIRDSIGMYREIKEEEKSIRDSKPVVEKKKDTVKFSRPRGMVSTKRIPDCIGVQCDYSDLFRVKGLYR